MQTPLAIAERVRKDGAKVLREALSTWKPWIPPGEQVHCLVDGILLGTQSCTIRVCAVLASITWFHLSSLLPLIEPEDGVVKRDRAPLGAGGGVMVQAVTCVYMQSGLSSVELFNRQVIVKGNRKNMQQSLWHP